MSISCLCNGIDDGEYDFEGENGHMSCRSVEVSIDGVSVKPEDDGSWNLVSVDGEGFDGKCDGECDGKCDGECDGECDESLEGDVWTMLEEVDGDGTSTLEGDG